MPRLYLLITFFALALSLGITARAGAATLAILRPASSEPAPAETLIRLQGELLAVGLDVQLIERPSDAKSGANDERAALERIAAERGIDAMIDVVGDTAPVAVDIWVFKRAPARSEVSRVVVEANRANPAETLAIRAIDVLRSRLVEIDLAARRKPRQSLVETRYSPPRHPERLGFAAGAVVLASLDNVGPAVLPLLRLHWAPHTRLVAQATFAAFGSRPNVVGVAGSARVAQGYALLGLCYCLPAEPGLRPFAAVAAGALRTSLEGEARPPAAGHAVEQWSFLLEGSVGARLRMHGPFFVTLESQVHLAEPYVSIHLADAVVASTGRPNLLFALTAGAWL